MVFVEGHHWVHGYYTLHAPSMLCGTHGSDCSMCSCSLSSGSRVQSSLSPIDLPPELWGQSSTHSDGCPGLSWVLCSPWDPSSVSTESSGLLTSRSGNSPCISQSMVLVRVSCSTPWVSRSQSWSICSTIRGWLLLMLVLKLMTIWTHSGHT